MRSHGTFSCYLGGCRCTPCIEAQREYFRDYRRRKKGEESRPLFLISSGDLTNVPVAGENWRAAIASAFLAAPAGTMLGNVTKIRRQGSKQVLFTLTMGILEEFDLLERPSDQDPG